MPVNGRTIYTGSIELDYRIFTNNSLEVIEDGIYEITAHAPIELVPGEAGFRLPASPGAIEATATIDGTEYSGFLIRVEDHKVFIDGEEVGYSPSISR